MNLPVLVAASGITGVLWIPSLVFAAECALALLPARRTVPLGPRPRIAVVVPAHDEEAGIAATLRTILPELVAGDRLLVVADNCTDRTAEVARLEGASVVERHDPSRRGKGYALTFAFDALAESPPDVVVVVDADCRLRQGDLSLLGTLSRDTLRPVQADYLLSAPPGASVRTRVSAFAVLVRNRVRPRGLHRLGLPCQLTGSGMAFPWEVIRKAAPPGGNIVEDLALGIDLAEQGHPPLFCPQARVMSFLPAGDGAADTQRRRWETGQLSSLRQLVPRLLAAAVAQRRLDLLALGLDLAVPPLSLLVGLVSFGAAATGVAFLLGSGPLPAVSAAAQAAVLAGAVTGAWAVFGRGVLPLRDAVAVPGYVLWKMRLFGQFLRRGTEREWVRTERDSS